MNDLAMLERMERITYTQLVTSSIPKKLKEPLFIPSFFPCLKDGGKTLGGASWVARKENDQILMCYGECIIVYPSCCFYQYQFKQY